MQLDDYLDWKKLTVTEFAGLVERRLGRDPEDDAVLKAATTRVWRHVHGKRHPGPEDQVLYEELTGGAVTRQDWFERALKNKDQPPDDAAETVAATG